MDREHVKGAPEKVKRAINDTAGKVTRDKELQAEVKFDKAQGVGFLYPQPQGVCNEPE